jgi:hypothetical protein
MEHRLGGIEVNISMKVLDYQDEKGAIGYILLWLMGVPASLLFLIFLVRGCT